MYSVRSNCRLHFSRAFAWRSATWETSLTRWPKTFQLKTTSTTKKSIRKNRAQRTPRNCEERIVYICSPPPFKTRFYILPAPILWKVPKKSWWITGSIVFLETSPQLACQNHWGTRSEPETWRVLRYMHNILYISLPISLFFKINIGSVRWNIVLIQLCAGSWLLQLSTY